LSRPLGGEPPPPGGSLLREGPFFFGGFWGVFIVESLLSNGRLKALFPKKNPPKGLPKNSLSAPLVTPGVLGAPPYWGLSQVEFCGKNGFSFGEFFGEL